MSRSRKRTPVFNLAGDKGRKADRVLANRQFRRKEKMAIVVGDDPPEKIEEVSDRWCWDCDGWRWVDPSSFDEEFQASWNRK